MFVKISIALRENWLHTIVDPSAVMRISLQYDVGLNETVPEAELRMGEVVVRMVRRRVRVKVFMVYRI